jgi:hypothetical protein
MSGQVNVDDFEVFRLFRAALLKFAQAANQSLANADAQVARVHLWLENEQTPFWQNQLRKRTEAVTLAKEAVRHKKLYKDATGRTPGAIEEEKHLARCRAAVVHAEQKIQAVRKWLPRLEHAAGLYRGGVARLHSAIDSDIPQAVALLDRLAVTLEEYVQLEIPAGAAEAAPDASVTLETSMSRGGDTLQAPAPSIAPPATPAAGGEAPPSTPKETPHVPPGN